VNSGTDKKDKETKRSKRPDLVVTIKKFVDAGIITKNDSRTIGLDYIYSIYTEIKRLNLDEQQLPFFSREEMKVVNYISVVAGSYNNTDGAKRISDNRNPEEDIMEITNLAESAATAVVGALAKGATEAAVAQGQKVWAWARSQLAGSPGEAVILAAEAAPQKTSSRKAVEAQLLALLEDRPELAAELQALVREAAPAAVQTATITGDGSAINQIVGSGNTVSTRR